MLSVVPAEEPGPRKRERRPDMAADDEIQPDYAAALSECGFDAAGVQRGLRMLDSGRYVGFADVVSSLSLEGSTTLARQHEVEAVMRRVTAEEMRASVARRGVVGLQRIAEVQAQQRAEESQQLESMAERRHRMQAVLAEMTDDEGAGRVPLRPHLAEALQSLRDA